MGVEKKRLVGRKKPGGLILFCHQLKKNHIFYERKQRFRCRRPIFLAWLKTRKENRDRKWKKKLEFELVLMFGTRWWLRALRNYHPHMVMQTSTYSG